MIFRGFIQVYHSIVDQSWEAVSFLLSGGLGRGLADLWAWGYDFLSLVTPNFGWFKCWKRPAFLSQLVNVWSILGQNWLKGKLTGNPYVKTCENPIKHIPQRLRSRNLVRFGNLFLLGGGFIFFLVLAPKAPRSYGSFIIYRSIYQWSMFTRCMLCIRYTLSSIYLSIYPSIYPSIDLSICLSIYLSIYLTIYLSIYLSNYLTISLSDSIYIILYLSISIYIYLYLSISIYIYLYLSISICIYIYFYLYLRIYIYLYLSISVSISISIYIYLYPSISIYIYLYLCIYIYLYIYISTYLYLSISIYIYLYLSISTSMAVSIYLYIYIIIYISIYLRIYIYLSIYIYIYIYLYLSKGLHYHRDDIQTPSQPWTKPYIKRS